MKESTSILLLSILPPLIAADEERETILCSRRQAIRYKMTAAWLSTSRTYLLLHHCRQISRVTVHEELSHRAQCMHAPSAAALHSGAEMAPDTRVRQTVTDGGGGLDLRPSLPEA